MNPSRASVSTAPDPAASDSRPVFDPGVAHPARVYNYWLGGKDHYPADRAVGDEVARRRPHVVAGARANRAFHGRAVHYLAAGCGIRQFLDIGTGLPGPSPTHEIAQQVAPECAVAYADNDPLVLVYARALLTSKPQGRCGYIGADLRDPHHPAGPGIPDPGPHPAHRRAVTGRPALPPRGRRPRRHRRHAGPGLGTGKLPGH